MAYASRVTVDVDSHVRNWRLRAVRAYYELQRRASSVEVRISSSGKGIHLVGYFNEVVSEREQYQLRRMLGDDPGRIELDRERAEYEQTTQVLWSSKGDGEVDDDFESIGDALDHIDKRHVDDGFRMRRLVNDGRKAYSSHTHPAQG